MYIPHLTSIRSIQQTYNTGEKPVLVVCSDKNTYVCKYMRHKGSINKLVSEFIGSVFAVIWDINSPNIALVDIKRSHMNERGNVGGESKIAIGSCYESGTVDVSSSNVDDILPTWDLLAQLLKIALYDCWVSNEDRNDNNTNLMYNTLEGKMIPIDYGCIFNTATFDLKLSPITFTDTILSSSLFSHLYE